MECVVFGGKGILNKSDFEEVNNMSEFSINQMQEMQRSLQNKYKDKWEQISPEAGKHKMLWMIGEIGEVIDIVKKQERNLLRNWLTFLCTIMI